MCSDRVRDKGSLRRYVKLSTALISSKSGHESTFFDCLQLFRGVKYICNL